MVYGVFVSLNLCLKILGLDVVLQVDYACTPEEVQQHFQSCGTVNRVTILTDKFGQPKGFAYVEFVETEAVQEALLLTESELHGRQLKVTFVGFWCEPRCISKYHSESSIIGMRSFGFQSVVFDCLITFQVLPKRTNVPGMKQYRPRRFNPYMGFRFRRPYVPPYFYSPYGYGYDTQQSLTYIFMYHPKYADWSCLLSFLPHFKSAAGRFLGSEGQRDTCLTTRSSFASCDYCLTDADFFFSFLFIFLIFVWSLDNIKCRCLLCIISVIIVLFTVWQRWKLNFVGRIVRSVSTQGVPALPIFYSLVMP